jgi:hypothetical protein
MNKDDIICIMMYSGQVVIGRFNYQNKETDEVTIINIKNPKVITTQESKNKTSVILSLLNYIGTPEEIQFRYTDIYTMYKVEDKELLSNYIRSTSMLEIVPSGSFNPKGGMN